jgi:hypothetical protein
MIASPEEPIVAIDSSLKMNNDSRRNPHIILRIAEETGLQQVTLQSPTDEGDQVVVEAAAQRVSKRGVRARQQRCTLADVRGAD